MWASRARAVLGPEHRQAALGGAVDGPLALAVTGEEALGNEPAQAGADLLGRAAAGVGDGKASEARMDPS